MSRNISFILAPLLAAVAGSGCSKSVSYSEDVFPILERNCLPCHSKGGKGYEATGFSMETYEDFMKGTKFGPVIWPGSGFTSTLGILISHKADASINMPQDEPKIPEKQIELIKIWIDQGAKNN